ncbi:hypothetical protein BGW80DRAFT_1348336, partial [Lactifluus volemus]
MLARPSHHTGPKLRDRVALHRGYSTHNSNLGNTSVVEKLFDIPPPRLHKRSQLRSLHDPMTRRPA